MVKLAGSAPGASKDNYWLEKGYYCWSLKQERAEGLAVRCHSPRDFIKPKLLIEKYRKTLLRRQKTNGGWPSQSKQGFVVNFNRLGQ